MSWTPNFKIFTPQSKIEYPVGCEVKYDGEFVHWDGQQLTNKHGVVKQTVTPLPPIQLYGEYYYGEGKEFYSELHSHDGIECKVILYDTADYGLKPYIQRRTDLELSGLPLVPMEICHTDAEMFAYFKKVTDQGYEGIVIKPLASLDDSNWLKMKREYTATLLVRGLRKDRMTASVAMGTASHVYCNCSLQGWGNVIDMLNVERMQKGKNWVVDEDEINILVDSSIKLEIKHNGLINGKKFRNPRIKRIRSWDSEINIQQGGECG